MKRISKNSVSSKETFLIFLNLAILWGGFIHFGQFFSFNGYYAVSWKWQLVSLGSVTILSLISLFFLLYFLTPGSKAWFSYTSLKEKLNRKPAFLLLIPFLVVILSIPIYLYPLIRGLLGINAFSLMLVWFFLFPMVLFILSFSKKQVSTQREKTHRQLKKGTGSPHLLYKIFFRLGKWNTAWMIMLFGVYLVSFFTPWSLYNLPSWLALLIFLPLAFLFSLGMRAIFPGKSWGYSFIVSILMVAAGASLAAFFTQVSNNPFSLGWSEGTWIFNGSLIFSKFLFGSHLDLPIQYPNRAILQSIPFLVFPTAPLWIHRMWQAVLWGGLLLAFGVLFSKRLDLSGLSRFVFIIWIFLFLQQGPVYYFLIIAPILILLAGKAPPFWLATLLVIAASFWIGIDRVNWFPLPGCLMTLMYLLETRYSGRFWAYWWKPLIWITGGTLVAFASQFGLWLVSGYPASYFLSSVASKILTYRLLPNTSYPIGILPMISLTVLPIVSILLVSVCLVRKNVHWSRRWMLLVILGVFFLGGILVSMKIGGGTNLHNLDAFLLLLVVSTIMFFLKKVSLDTNATTESLHTPAWMVGMIALIPVFASFLPAPLLTYSKTDAQAAINEIHRQISQLPPGSKPVLFIAHPQLLATGQVKNVLPVPAYEMVLMMEMAMAENHDYLEKLYSDLSNQRYSLIIAPELNTFQKGPEWALGEENNVWNSSISVPILRYYHGIFTQKDFNLEILVPNEPSN